MNLRRGFKAISAIALISLALNGFGKEMAAMPSVNETGSKSALKLTMRVLWEDHINFTRSYIVSTLADLPDTEFVAQRLLKNQDDIGEAMKPYYGNNASDKLTALLRDHILIAAAVVRAAKSGDSKLLAETELKWSENSKEMAVFWSTANRNLSQQRLEKMLQDHLNLTTAEVVNRLKKDWAKDIAAYDEGHRHMMVFSDLLSDGIITQFPAKFK